MFEDDQYVIDPQLFEEDIEGQDAWQVCISEDFSFYIKLPLLLLYSCRKHVGL